LSLSTREQLHLVPCGLGAGTILRRARWAAPRVNGNAGRDHWTYCYSVLFAGAGVRGGTAYGASDAHAAFAKDRPVSPADACATVYACLGIDPELALPDRAGRPVPVAHGGQPVRDVLA